MIRVLHVMAGKNGLVGVATACAVLAAVAALGMSLQRALRDGEMQKITEPAMVEAVQPAPVADARGIAALQWFGVDPLSDAGDANALSGQLVVKGISIADAPKKSGAFIAVQGQPEQWYAVGDALPGGGTLAAVKPGAVEIRHGDARHTVAIQDYSEPENSNNQYITDNNDRNGAVPAP